MQKHNANRTRALYDFVVEALLPIRATRVKSGLGESEKRIDS